MLCQQFVGKCKRPRADINAEKVKSVFSGAVNIKKATAQYNKDKNKLVTEGTAEILLVCENNVLVENEELFVQQRLNTPSNARLTPLMISLQPNLLLNVP